MSHTDLTAEDLMLLELAPRQARIVLLMQQDPDREWAPDTLRLHFGWTLGATAYHVRALRKQGWLRKPRKSQVRGALQSWYLPDRRMLIQARAEAVGIRQDQLRRVHQLQDAAERDLVAA